MTLHGMDENYEAEEDAHTLARAKEIEGDGGRLSKAKQAAHKLQEKEQKKADAMAQIANAKMDYKHSEHMGKNKG